jgi:hypothetical protein
MIISLGRRLPGASSDLPGSHPDRANPPSPFFPCGQSDDVAPLFGLAPSGVCQAKPVTRPAGELLPHRFTLTPAHRSTPWRSVFCGTFPSRDQSGGGRYPPPRPTESGLSSTACPQSNVAIKPSAVAIIQSVTNPSSILAHLSPTSTKILQHLANSPAKLHRHPITAACKFYLFNFLTLNFPF